VFVYRGELPEVAAKLGVDVSKFSGPIIRSSTTSISAIRRVISWRRASSCATRRDVRVECGIDRRRQAHAADPPGDATVNDPIVAAYNGTLLRNSIKLAP